MSALDGGRWLAPLLICPHCGLAQLQPPLPGPAVLGCRRCGAILRRVAPGSIGRAVHLHLAALVSFAIANLYPFLAFSFEGRGQVTILASGVMRLWREGMPLLAAIVAAASLLFPAAKMLATLWALGPLVGRFRLPGQARALRLADALRAWSMLDVFLLAVAIAWIKMGEIASLEAGVGLFAFLAALLLATAADAGLDHHDAWDRLAPQATAAQLRAGPSTALAGCGACGQVIRAGPAPARCPRCRAVVRPPDPASLERASALLLAAAAFYLPANLLPVMTVVSLGRAEPATILEGVVKLFELGMYPVASVVFVASVLVPVLKILALGHLLASVARGDGRRCAERAALFRLLEAIGRWSMVDVFVVALLVALVDFGPLARIEAGPGITAFALTVIFTMLASASFDPRLIWTGSVLRGPARVVP